MKQPEEKYGSPLLRQCMGQDDFDRYIRQRVLLRRRMDELIATMRQTQNLLGSSDAEERRDEELENYIKTLEGMN